MNKYLLLILILFNILCDKTPSDPENVIIPAEINLLNFYPPLDSTLYQDDTIAIEVNYKIKDDFEDDYTVYMVFRPESMIVNEPSALFYASCSEMAKYESNKIEDHTIIKCPVKSIIESGEILLKPLYIRLFILTAKQTNDGIQIIVLGETDDIIYWNGVIISKKTFHKS